MHGYGQYCPVAKGAEIFAERWTPLILRELIRGPRTFNEIHRGVPRISRTLLVSRLRKLGGCGVLERQTAAVGSKGGVYQLTRAGQELEPVVVQLGMWAQRWLRTKYRKEDLDTGVLMWDIRCTLNPQVFADANMVAQFVFTDVPDRESNWWLLCRDGELDLCPLDPGVEVGLIIHTTLATLTRIWMGDVPVKLATQDGRLAIIGCARLKRIFEKCFQLSYFAGVNDARKPPRALGKAINDLLRCPG